MKQNSHLNAEPTAFRIISSWNKKRPQATQSLVLLTNVMPSNFINLSDNCQKSISYKTVRKLWNLITKFTWLWTRGREGEQGETPLLFFLCARPALLPGCSASQGEPPKCQLLCQVFLPCNDTKKGADVDKFSLKSPFARRKSEKWWK